MPGLVFWISVLAQGHVVKNISTSSELELLQLYFSTGHVEREVEILIFRQHRSAAIGPRYVVGDIRPWHG